MASADLRSSTCPMLERLSPQPLQRQWLDTKPTYVVKRDLAPRLPGRRRDPASSFNHLLGPIRAHDPRRLTPEAHRNFVQALVGRAHALLTARGMAHSVEATEHSVFIALQPDAKDTRPFSRFIAASARQGIRAFYDPSYLLAYDVRAAADYRRHRLDVGHDDILNMDPSVYVMAHESVHLDTGRRLERGEPWWSYGNVVADTRKKRVLPGLGGGYGVYQCFDELRTNERDQRQLLRELERLAREPAPSWWTRAKRWVMRERNPLGRAFVHTHWKAEQMLQMSLRSIACLRQSLGALERGVACRFEVREGRIAGIMRVAHNGDPEGYELTMHLVDSRGIDDPRNRALLQTQLGWTLEGARGCLAQSRVILQALGTVKRDDRDGLRAVCQKLCAVIAKRPNEKAPGIPAPSYEQLLEVYNARAD